MLTDFERRGQLPRSAVRGTVGTLPRVLMMRHSGLSMIAQAQHGDGGPSSEPEIRDGYLYKDGLAVIEAVGPLLKYPMWGMPSSLLGIEHAANAAREDADVHSALIVVDSPGGQMAGMERAADAVHRLAQTKRTVAMIDDAGYSAGYWLPSQAGQVVINPSGGAGCIGVYTVLADTSKAWEKFGIELTVISTGRMKGMGADGKLTDEVIAEVQKEIDFAGNRFVRAVARGRRMTEQEARALMTGESWTPEEALERNLVDGIATLDEIVPKMMRGALDLVSPTTTRGGINKKTQKSVDGDNRSTLHMGQHFTDTPDKDADMTKEEFQNWLKTTEGSETIGSIVSENVQKTIAAKVESGELITRDSHTQALAARDEQAEKQRLRENKINSAAAEIHAIDKITAKEAIAKELAEVDDAALDYAIQAKKATAEKNAMRNSPAPRDDSSKLSATNTNTGEDAKAHFDRLIESGKIGKPRDEKHYAKKFRTFKKSRQAGLVEFTA